MLVSAALAVAFLRMGGEQAHVRAGLAFLGLAAFVTAQVFLRGTAPAGPLTSPGRKPESNQQEMTLQMEALQLELERAKISIQESQTAEERSRHQTHRLHAVFQQLNHPAGFLDPQGRILDVNDAVTSLLGQNVEELRGCLITELDAFKQGDFNLPLRRAIAGETVKFQKEFKSGDAPTHTISMSLKPVPGDSGRVELLIWEGHDITERVRAEEALQETFHQFQQSQKMEAIGRLAGGIAHDFNNLLTSILGFSNMAIEQLPEDSDVVDDLQEVVLAASRAQNLTQKLLALSRKDVPDSQPIDLNQLLKEMDNLIRVSLNENVEVVFNQGEGGGTILADPTSMEQVILNLTVNARDAMPRSGRLYISTFVEQCLEGPLTVPELPPGSYTVLSFRDTGCGMEEDVLEHIFEPFFTTKESGQGTGLGLSTVYAIVKQYKGGIHLWSEPGVGSEFKLYFPSFEHHEQMFLNLPKHETAKIPLPSGTETILLVEDEDGVRRMGARMIRSLGYDLLTAADGEEGVSVAEAHKGKIDLIITDVVMPNLSGPEMIDRLRLSLGHIPHLYVSGFTMDKLKEHGADDSEQNLVRKPYSRDQLARRIRIALDAG